MKLDVVTIQDFVLYLETLKSASQAAIIELMKKRAKADKITTAHIDGKINVLEANVRECDAQINHLRGLIE